MKENLLHFKEINAFDFKIKYITIDKNSPMNVHDPHIHEECEIYINISGDVSFAVENRIYPIKPGDIIITKPYEYHHCIYHSNKPHKHFWILFSASGNEELLDIFFNRKNGESNHLTLPPQEIERLISTCHSMVKDEDNSARSFYNFFRLLLLLQNAEIAENNETQYPTDIINAIKYISDNFYTDITVTDIARNANVSINTLERHFLQIFGQSPSLYIRKKRLANAARLLSEGKTVTEASIESGFSDYSNFIALFRKTYGITPLKYKKLQNNKSDA